ncbi:MAG: DNA replication and repair protein RecF [Acidobacteria bacterium]|nr:DNA replication and repair protein RecF [Acidobacteriota bacterium]
MSHLAWIEVESVRNLAPARIPLGPDPVLVTGANAQGKSSLLEAAYLLATTRSFRARDPREAITLGAPFLGVSGGLCEPEKSPLVLRFALPRERGGRVLRVGEYDAKLADYLGHLAALVLTGDGIRSIAGSPAERRRFVDRATAAAEPAHLAGLGEYRRALAHRNHLLRAGAADRDIDPWDEVLARTGIEVAARRRRQIAAWQGDLGAWPGLFPEGGRVALRYREPGPAGPTAGEKMTLLERLQRARERERRLGATLVGPHRDDLDIDLDGQDLLQIGSSGQVRAALGALVLAMARQVRASRGTTPLLLLDDADTDLDPDRCAAQLDAAGREAQLIAASSKPHLPVPEGFRRLHVTNGTVEKQTP